MNEWSSPLARKADTGCLQSQHTCLCPTCQPESPTFEGSSNEETRPDICTGRFWSPFRRKSGYEESEKYSESIIPNSPGRKRRTNTFSKRLLGLKERNSSWEPSLFAETAVPIGKQYGPPPSPEISQISNPIYVYGNLKLT